MAANRFASLKADTDIFTTFEGDNTVLMQLVAKSRLSEFKQEFDEINVFGLVKYITKQAATVLAEKNPIITRRTEEEHLLDPEFHLAAFKYREEDLLVSAARRLRHHIKETGDSFEGMLKCQTHLVNLADAYVNTIILEQFQAGIQRCEDASLKSVLTTLCNLYALHTIESQKGWFLEQNYLEGVKTKAIRQMVDKLCLDVRKDAVSLVDAFGIPDKILAAPIATKN